MTRPFGISSNRRFHTVYSRRRTRYLRHHSYDGAQPVVLSFHRDLDSAASHPFHAEPRDLGLPTSKSIKPSFAKPAHQLHVG